ncbi:lytic transglycosylase domain-containing protein [Salinarimonas soli]|uniref:Lytic transglycosylase domain-containing protein n=1 Tax=Salinarimonas soli TaxID=1638099 RepID=A0A5B2VHI1_9HYPH|nr:lytic transglycosylase domain-containing protein [Salinarimonas soli]KAA2237996.1 lytic transglycosylase domain-containing protein [Salinarimonas soli]
MFLFTTPPARETAPRSPVVDAIRFGADRTGTGFDYLLQTAQRESALDPKAKAKSSSASGLFQFVEQTWLGLMKQEGPKLGLEREAAAITTRGDGTHAIADPAMRGEVLGLREDPKVAAVMAGMLTQRNRDMLGNELGREPNAGDLYVAHFLGARGAADLIRLAQTQPSRPAADAFPEAAAANRAIFYDGRGAPRGAGEVYAGLVAAHRSVGAPVNAAPAFGTDKPLAPVQADGGAFHGLFREPTPGAVSSTVARLWRPTGGGASRTAALGGFFPRSTGAPEPQPAAPAPEAEPAPTLVEAPLPPPRPASLGGDASRATGRPLDLSRFSLVRRGS